MKEVLRFENVEMRYHTKQSETVAIKDLSFSVTEGEFLAVVGPSGCGKTTLLSLAAGLLTPSAGQVISGGVTFGYMLQKDELFPWRSVEKNVFLPLEIKHGGTPRESNCPRGKIRTERFYEKLSHRTFGRYAPTRGAYPYVGRRAGRSAA